MPTWHLAHNSIIQQVQGVKFGQAMSSLMTSRPYVYIGGMEEETRTELLNRYYKEGELPLSCVLRIILYMYYINLC